MRIIYEKSFLHQLKKLPTRLQDEVFEKIDLFIKDQFHPHLKTHKLHGPLKNYWSFSINYSYRIIFETIGEKTHFIEIGKNDIYK